LLGETPWTVPRYLVLRRMGHFVTALAKNGRFVRGSGDFVPAMSICHPAVAAAVTSGYEPQVDAVQLCGAF
jgi:hypothetical protein